MLGFGIGAFAPGHKSSELSFHLPRRRRRPLPSLNLKPSTSDTEPWIVGHNIILSHGYAARMYQKDFKSSQQGTIGITLNGDWAEPFSDTPEGA